MTTEAPRKPRPSLGRGLNALLGDIAPEAVPTVGGGETPAGIRMLPVGALTPQPGQPRRVFDEAALEELAQSIAARGVLQPILVRPHGRNYQIVAGERRWRAAQRAHLHDVPVIIRELTDVQTLELAIIENIQREDLNVIEEAEAYQKLTSDYGHTQEVLGKLVNKSRSHVANLLRLLELPKPVRDSVASGKLSMGHARALITAPNAEALAEEVIRRDLSVRDTEKLARTNKGKGTGSGPAAAPKGDASPGADIEALQRQLGDILGLKVQIEHGTNGGRVVVGYSTLDQLDLICQRLSGEPI